MLSAMLLIVHPALADELVVPALAEVAVDLATDDAAGKKKDKDKDGKDKDKDKDGKGKDKDKDDDKTKIAGFTIEPYVSPGGGVQIDTSGGTAVTAGVDVGVIYTKKKLEGNLYVGGAYITGEGVSGYDVHLGNTLGYRADYWGAAGGLAITYNGQTNTETGEDILAPALGAQIPVDIKVGPKKYYATAGVTPSWYFDDARKPEAGEVPLGDEFEWRVGAGLKIGDFKGEIGYATLYTSAGTYSTPTLSVGYNP